MIFNKTINKERLRLEIEKSSITQIPSSIISSGTSFDITFESTLSTEDTKSLEALISRHRSIPLEQVDTSVTARQIRTALIMSGITLSHIEAILDSLPEPDKTMASVAWNHSYRFHRDNVMVISLAPAMGLSEADLDDLWALAGSL